jgi:V8-like Glu-specific endopeptidase
MQMTITKLPNGPASIPVSAPALPPAIAPGDVGPSAGRASNDSNNNAEPGAPSPENYGSGNQNSIWHFNDYLVPAVLMKTFPYRASGWWLHQHQDGSWWICTASLIKRSLLVTAGHCVYEQGKGWIKDGYFYPGATGMNGGTQVKPYGYARLYQAWTWTAWVNGAALGTGQDVGVVVLKNRAGTKIEMGTYTGYYGFCYLNCLQNYWFLSQLGYPVNYYSANSMTQSQHLVAKGTVWASWATGDHAWGSGMEGGSSGGPGVSNIGDISDTAADPGQYTYRNIIFNPTSWGYSGGTYKVQGGSALSSGGGTDGFKPLYNAACQSSRTLHGTGSCDLL